MGALRYTQTIKFLFLMMLGLLPTQAFSQQKHSDTFDTMIEYVPYTSVFVLKACGVESRDDCKKLVLTTAASWVAAAGSAYILKHSIKEWRPDHSDQKSFPSGHATIAFAGATALHREFGHISPWISISGYGLATFVAVDRVCRDRHHWYDVAAGAGIGFTATTLTWWISDKFIKNDHVALGFSGNTIDLAIRL